MRQRVQLGILIFALITSITQSALAQQQPARVQQGQQQPRFVPEDHRPSLFFRESFKKPEIPELPVTQAHMESPNLELKLYGRSPQHIGTPDRTDADNDTGIWLINRASPKDDPTFIYTGTCILPCALAFRDKANFVDLTGLAKIRWRHKQGGFHMLRPIIKLDNGTYLVGDHGEERSPDWRETEFSISSVRWLRLNTTEVITEGNDQWVIPDLSRVDEVGFVDLMPGNITTGGNGGAGVVRLDWMEVYGVPVPRTADAKTAK